MSRYTLVLLWREWVGINIKYRESFLHFLENHPEYLALPKEVDTRTDDTVFYSILTQLEV